MTHLKPLAWKWHCVLFLLAAGVLQAGEPALPKLALKLVDLDSKAIIIPEVTGKATVLLFLSTTCPICNNYAPELQRLAADYADKGIRFVILQTEADLDAEAAKQHAREFKLPFPTVLDPKHQWSKAMGATTTPEAVLVSPTGQVLYRGCIDDRFPALGKDSVHPRNLHLRRALNEVLAGKPVSIPITPAIGCAIE